MYSKYNPLVLNGVQPTGSRKWALASAGIGRPYGGCQRYSDDALQWKGKAWRWHLLLKGFKFDDHNLLIILCVDNISFTLDWQVENWT